MNNYHLIHKDPYPYCGLPVILKDRLGFSSRVFVVEDWWDRLSGCSWKLSSPSPVCYQYLSRIPIDQATSPTSDEVLYGKIDGLGYLIHIDEIQEPSKDSIICYTPKYFIRDGKISIPTEFDYLINGLGFYNTCLSMPEQYDVWYNDKLVAYIRLRNGYLYLSPYSDGDLLDQIVLDEEWFSIQDGDKSDIPNTEDYFNHDGSFSTEDERIGYLTWISRIIHQKID